MLSRLLSAGIVIGVMLAGERVQAGPATAPSAPPGAHDPVSVATTKAAGGVLVEETSLGNLGGFESVRNIAMSLDVSHVAFIGVEGKKQYVVVDGKRGPGFDWIIPNSLNFGPGALHVGYLVQTPTQTIPVIDDQPGKGFYLVDHNRMYWSGDRKHVALIVQEESGGMSMLADGVVGTKYDAIDPPYYSPDSKHFAFVAKRGKQQFIVLDGKEQKAYDAVGRLTFSPDGTHLSGVAAVGGKVAITLDGQEGKAYDGVKLGPGFSTDGKRLVAVVAQGGKLVVVINGRESPPYEAIVAGDFVLSPDGKRTAYAIKQGDKQVAVIDGVPQHPYARIGANGLAFSPDSKHIAYVAGDDAKGPDFVVRDGVAEKGYEGILVGTPLFSPDSKHLAYGAKVAGKWKMVVDQAEGKAYDVIEPPAEQIFSIDSKRLAYRAMEDHKSRLVIDGTEALAADYFGPPAFSPDSRHVALLQFYGEKCWLVVDNQKLSGPYTPATPEMRVIFDNNTHAHFIAGRNEELFRINLTFTQ